MTVFGLTDKGLARPNNEDNFTVDENIKLLVVCDGAGGQATGEVASSMATSIIKGQMQLYARDGFKLPQSEKDAKYSDVINCLLASVRMANSSIYEASKKYPQNLGMATTCVCAVVGEKNISYCHVGDSRLYLVREGFMQLLTSDHSLVNEQLKRGLITEEQAEQASYKNVLTRALGPDENVEIDVNEIEFFDGDRLLLCSDGLTRMLNDDLILETLKKEPEPRSAGQKLVDLANSLGGRDNITLIISNLEKDAQKSKSFFSSMFKGAKK